MKRIVVLVLLIAVATVSMAEEKMLLGDATVSNLYGGPLIQITQIDGQWSILSGGRGALIIDHRFIIGGAGYAVAIPLNKEVLGSTNQLRFEYGGLELGATISWDSIVHLTTHTTMGAGSVRYLSPYESSKLYVIEPHAYLELNVASWIRVCVGGGYRFVFGVAGISDLTDADLRGPSGELLIKFGGF